jgi:hypothetical protein
MLICVITDQAQNNDNEETHYFMCKNKFFKRNKSIKQSFFHFF